MECGEEISLHSSANRGGGGEERKSERKEGGTGSRGAPLPLPFPDYARHAG